LGRLASLSSVWYTAESQIGSVSTAKYQLDGVSYIVEWH